MIISELCANGDLFDYVRNVPPPSLYRVVRNLEIVILRIRSHPTSSPSCLTLRKV